jgi:hypothetical protein
MIRTFVVAGIATALTLAGAAWGGGWVVETITDKDNGKGCSLVVDALGDPHVAYIDQSGREDNVMYATKKNDVWSYDVVAINKTVTGPTAITADGNNFPYVLYPAGSLNYAYKDISGWHTETAANANPTHLSFAPWPFGYAAFSYSCSVGTTGSYLGYGAKSGGTWATEKVTPNYDMGSGANTLIVDAGKVPHVIFNDLMSKKAVRATRGASAWEFEDIGDGTDCCAYLTPDGKIHVSYTKNDNSALLYAVYANDEWTTETVDKAKGLPGLSQICVNYEGTVFISYFNWEATNFHVVTKENGKWSDQLVITGKGQGYPHAMAIGNEQYPQLVFYNANIRKLRYATYDPTLNVELTKSAAERSGGKAHAFALFQNAPNPLSSATTFTFELAEGADVRLAVYDAAGRRVAVPAEGYYGPGRHDVPFACGLAPGVYVYRVEAGANVAARKMVVVD